MMSILRADHPVNANTNETLKCFEMEYYNFRIITVAVLATIAMMLLMTKSFWKDWIPTITNEVTPYVTRDVFNGIPEDKTFTTPSHSEFQKKEVRHVGFLKVHKAASSTLQNMFYRFGLKRNLSFVLPASSNYLSRVKYSYDAILPPFPVNAKSQKQGKYDILCNHVVFNYDLISNLLHEDAVYVAIVREPLDQFISSAYYYKYVWKFKYLAKLANDTFVTDLIRDPKKYEAPLMNRSMTYNSMAYDFGLDFFNVAEAEKITQETFQDFLKKTGDIFKFVMIVERFDESLVLLKRYLNWTLSDIIYLKNNVLPSKEHDKNKPLTNITEADRVKFRHRNRFDYGIYEFFKARFEKQLEAEDNIKEETQHFQTILTSVRTYCLVEHGKQPDSPQVEIEASIWNAKFIVTKNDCKLMLKNELTLLQAMRTRHLELREGK